MTATISEQLAREVYAATLAAQIPDVYWIHGDDLCDCTFQRIGEWTNPYIARTLRVRFCCIWNELYKQYPQFVQEIPAYHDGNREVWVMEPRAWDSEEMPMPLTLWYRQLASATGQSVGEIRDLLKGHEQERPGPLPAGSTQRDTPTDAELAAGMVTRLYASTYFIPEPDA